MPDNGFGWHLADRPPTSDEFVAAQARYYHHMIEVFGADRCMFESNFPVDKMSHLVSRALERPQEDRREREQRREGRVVRRYRDPRLPALGPGRDLSESTCLIVVERLRHLGLGVHHERPVGEDRLADRLATEQEHVELRPRARRNLDRVTVAEDGELSESERQPLGPIVPEPARP